jgi:hypothetical protein
MCDEHDHQPEPAAPGLLARLSRRQVLQGAVALAAVAGLSSARGAAAAGPLGARAQSVDGLTARSLAMHLHASSSEGVGSIRAHLGQAVTNGFDVAWFTDHDWRRRRLLFRQTYSFTANEVQFGGTWNVPKMANVGSLTSTSGGVLVSTPVTADPATKKGSLRIRATSTGSAQATARNRVNAEGSSRANFRGRIAGRTIVLDVLPSRAGVDAWGEVLLRLSWHPGSGTRPAGVLTLTYRLRADITTPTRSSSGLAGFVDVPVAAGGWRTVTLDPVADVRGLWPDIAAEDNSLNEIEFHAASRRKAFAEYFFGYLRFVEQGGYDALGVENALLAQYAGLVPNVLGLNGTEISLGDHLNQYGGTSQAPFDYGAVTSLKNGNVGLRPDVVAHVHGLGGLISINHPFKPGDGNSSITASGVAADLISTALDGADMLEVGYTSKGTNGTLAAHLAAWDAVSRNGLFVTGNGVSDDHTGQNWAKQSNRFWTGAWTATLSEATLLDAFRAGRSYVGLLGSFSGAIDMAVDGAPMGSVLVGGATSRSLNVAVTGLPTGAGVQVLRGDVDYSGTASPVPNTTVLRTLGPNDLATPVTLDTSDDCFVRLQVVNSAGAVIGFGQPTWALHSQPGTGVPAARLVTE